VNLLDISKGEEEDEAPDEYKEIQNLRYDDLFCCVSVWDFVLTFSFFLLSSFFFLLSSCLRVRIGEGKNLIGEKPSKKLEKAFDPYCVMLVDSERKGISTTKSTTNPFWGEEFFLE